MLESLRAVDWSNMEHAYGSAEDVPEVLEALVSRDESAQARAKNVLWGSLYHQGTVYGATSAAVPFFLEMLGDTTGRVDRAWVLYYLSNLVCGASYLHVHREVMFYEEMDERALEERLALEQGWVLDVRDAVCLGLETYEGLLVDADEGVRMNAAHVLGVLGACDAGVVARLEAALEADADERVRASALLALGALDEVGHVERCGRAFTGDASALVRWCAAREWVAMEGPATPEAVADVLASALFSPAAIEGSWETTPWARGHVIAQTAVSMARLGGERAERHVDELVVAMEQAEPIGSIDVAESLVLIAFEGLVPLSDYAQMTRLQRRVLDALAACDTPWTFNYNMSEMLRFYHLPAWRDRLREFVAGSARAAS